jgi:hypothetical protein
MNTATQFFSAFLMTHCLLQLETISLLTTNLLQAVAVIRPKSLSIVLPVTADLLHNSCTSHNGGLPDAAQAAVQAHAASSRATTVKCMQVTTSP